MSAEIQMSLKSELKIRISQLKEMYLHGIINEILFTKTKPFATEDQQDKNVDAADPPAKEDDRSFNGSKSKNNRLFPSHDTLSDYDGEGR